MENKNLVKALCYALGLVTGVAFLLIEPHNKDVEVRFHAWQSILLGVGVFALQIVLMIIFSIVPFLWIFSMVFSLAILVGWIFMLVQTYQGTTVRVPVIAEYADKFAQK